MVKTSKVNNKIRFRSNSILGYSNKPQHRMFHKVEDRGKEIIKNQVG